MDNITSNSTPMKAIMNNGFFLKFHKDSRLAESIFSDSPTYKNHPISIFQIMLIGDGDLIVELTFIQ